jgi:hypothetical protein
VILLRLQNVGGRSYYQVTYTCRQGETIQSPLMTNKEEAIKWVVWLIQTKTKAHASPSPKAG